jgi:hypothetical protein
VSKIKSPREKKTLSLKKDRRNIFGENSKASRKAIPRRKQLNHMGERRAVSQILSHLRESAEEKDANEADFLAKTTLVERKHKAFKKSPDSPLGVVLEKKLAKRREQSQGGRTHGVPCDTRLQSDEIFDTPYDPTLHKRLILRELRYRAASPRWGRHKKKTRRYGRYEREVAARWREAILRAAPLLEGFFGEEPQWRERTLRWCEEALTIGPNSHKSR